MHKGREDLISPKEAEEGIEIVSKICGVDKEKINYPTVECNGVIISEHNFDFFPRELLDVDFKHEIKFINCKFGSWENFNLYNTSSNFLVFENCEFDYICLNNDLVTDNIFELNNKLYFFGCKFNGDIDVGKANINREIKFKGCDFKYSFHFNIEKYLEIIKIKNCIFHKSFFMSGSFKNNLYFNNSHFKDYADFHECEFEKTASFYGVTFEKTPNFSQAVFKGNLNIVNANLNFTFDDLQEKIKQEYEDFNKGKNEQYKKPLDKFANDFRDSFRVFKNALIKDNNLLEASNFHKYELYCKEIELNSNDILSKYERDGVFDKLSLRFKQKVDWYLLLFYRKLSDHHTDLLKVINNCFILIAIYFICIFNFTNIDFLGIKEINIFSFLKSFSFYGDDKIVAAAKAPLLYFLLLLFFAPVVIFIASLYYSDKQKRSVIFKKIKFKVGKFLLIVAIFAVMQLILFVINFDLFVPLIKIVVFLGIFF